MAELNCQQLNPSCIVASTAFTTDLVKIEKGQLDSGHHQ